MKNNKINNSLVNSKLKSLIKPLYTLIVVAIPSLFIWIYLGCDFKSQENSKPVFAIEYNILIALSFIIIIILITSFLIYFKILPISVLNFVIPIVICFMGIFLSSWIKGDYQWYRLLIILPLILTVIPTNMFVNKLERKQKIKYKLKK